MTAAPNPPPNAPLPDRAPFGSVRLTGPVAPAARPRGRQPGGRWFRPRVELPVLTVEGLRGGGPARGG